MGTSATTRSVDRGATNPMHRLVNRAGAGLRRDWIADIGVVLGFLVLALWVCRGLWPDPATRELALNPEDQILIEWFLAVDTRVLLGDHGLLTDRLNAPDGVNLVVNATSLTLGFLLAPVTLTLGAPVSFAVLTVGNLAGTAGAWYLLFARTFRAHRAAAAVAGGFCGFAPAMISHSNSHWHMTAQWLVPPIVWSVVRMVRAVEAAATKRVVTSGVILGVLVAVQYFLGAEVLYLTALTLALFSLAYAVVRWRWTQRIAPWFLAGMAVAVGVGALLLAYPIWFQLAGPGSVSGGPFSPYVYSADLRSWVTFSPLSLGGTDEAERLASGPAEYNTFLGWPLLLVTAGCVVWLRRQAAVIAVAITGVLMGVLSLGPRLVVDGEQTGIPLPYIALVGLPVIDGALPQRYAVAVVPLIALVLMWAIERARGLSDPGWLVVPVTIGITLLPLFPGSLPAQQRDPVPEFISAGHWRQCVPEGGVLVPVPLPTPPRPEPMRWAAAANAEFALPQGFFIGPYGGGGTASMGIYPRPTSILLADVAATGRLPVLEEGHQIQARADLAYWGADCVAVAPGQRYEQQLISMLNDLLGPGERIADTWVWRVST